MKDYHAKLSDQLDRKIREERPFLAKKKNIFHPDNIPGYKNVSTMEKINELKYELLPHPLHSPDLAPSNFYLFPNLKKSLVSKRFSSNEELMAALNDYFAELPESHYRDGIKALERRWNECIAHDGNYFEK